MKRNFNVIEINGLRGIVLAAGVVICLAAGFIVFPGIVMKCAWNLLSAYTSAIPSISVLQGVLLWGICIAGYFAFKKKTIIEFHSMNNLSGAEMEEVMKRVRLQHQSDLIKQSILKAKSEIKTQACVNNKETCVHETEENRVDI